MQADGAGSDALQAPKIRCARANELNPHAFSQDQAAYQAATMRFFLSVEEKLDLAARRKKRE